MTETITQTVSAFTTLVFWAYVLTHSIEDKEKWERRLRPNRVRAKHRAGIQHAHNVLRLIEATHYFEDNLDETIAAFIPTGSRGPFWDAFRRTYKAKATRLYWTQQAWGRFAVKPGPHRLDW